MTYATPPGNNSGTGFGRLLVYLTLFCVLGFFAYRYYQNDLSDYTLTPKEITFEYVDSDFKPSINEESALGILSNPKRYRKEFNDLVFETNLQLINHVSSRMGLGDTVRSKAIQYYKEQHPALADLYYNDFIRLKDTSSQLYQQWYQNEGANAVEVWNEVVSKYTCFFITQVFSAFLPMKEGKIFIKGKKIDTPCGLATSEALAPMLQRLKERAAINDFSASKGMLEQRIERVIAELATIEIRDKKGLTRQMQTKLFGFPISSTDMEVSAISLMKIGFKLDQQFEISVSARQKTVTVTLPEPVILSHEVYPKFDKLDIGWMREVESIDLNKNINSLREAFRAEALESDVFEKSKTQAVELMNTMLGPLVQSIGPSYKLAVKFRNPNDNPVLQTPAQNAN